MLLKTSKKKNVSNRLWMWSYVAFLYPEDRVGLYHVYKLSHTYTDTKQQLPVPSLESRLHWVSICRMESCRRLILKDSEMFQLDAQWHVGLEHHGADALQV